MSTFRFTSTKPFVRPPSMLAGLGADSASYSVIYAYQDCNGYGTCQGSGPMVMTVFAVSAEAAAESAKRTLTEQGKVSIVINKVMRIGSDTSTTSSVTPWLIVGAAGLAAWFFFLRK